MVDMQTLKELLKNDIFAARAGVELLVVEPGYARARMEVTPEHLNAGGVCQGGALFTLADLAFAAVANSRQNLTLSLNANMTFLRAVSSGFVYADARAVYPHRRVPFIEVRLSDEKGELIAMMTSSGYRKNDALPVDGLM